MLRSLLMIGGGAALFIVLGFVGAYLAGIVGALIGMVAGIVAFFLMAAHIVGQ